MPPLFIIIQIEMLNLSTYGSTFLVKLLQIKKKKNKESPSVSIMTQSILIDTDVTFVLCIKLATFICENKIFPDLI